MPKPWEITIEQARKEGEELRERLRAADRESAYLFVQQLAMLDEQEDDADEEEDVEASD